MAAVTLIVKTKVLTMGGKAPHTLAPFTSPTTFPSLRSTPLTWPCSLSLRHALPQDLHTDQSVFLEHSFSRRPYNLFSHFFQGSAQMSPSHKGLPCVPHPTPLVYHWMFNCLLSKTLSSPLSLLLALYPECPEQCPAAHQWHSICTYQMNE